MNANPLLKCFADSPCCGPLGPKSPQAETLLCFARRSLALRLSRLPVLLLICICSSPIHADNGAPDPLAKPTTRLGPSYTFQMNVSVQGIDEKELCGKYILDRDSSFEPTLGYKPVGKVRLGGLTVEEARKRVVTVLSPYFRDTPEVRVTISNIPRFQVLVDGAAPKTGIISLPDGARLSDLIAETGYAGDANLHRVKVVRVEGGSRTQLLADFQRVLEGVIPGDDRLNDPPLKNGDVISLEQSSVLNVQAQNVVLLGEVRHQGTVPYKRGMTVRDAFDQAFGLTANADREKITIRRLRDGSLISVNADRIQKNIPTDNIALEPDDTIVVQTRDTGLRVSVVGAVPAPRTFDFKAPITLKQAIADAGGLKPDADTRSIVIARNMLNDPSKVQQITVNFDRIRSGEMPDIPLQAGDLVQVSQKRKAPSQILNIGLMLLRTLLF